jgi:hypothetical protein
MSPRYSCPHDGQHASRRLAQRTISAPSGSLAVEYTGSSPCSTTPRSRTVWRHAPVRRTCCSQRSRLGSRARSGRGGSRRPAHRRAAPSPKDPPHAHKTDTSAREHADARDSTIRRFRSLVSLVMNVRTRSSRCPSLGADPRRSRVSTRIHDLGDVVEREASAIVSANPSVAGVKLEGSLTRAVPPAFHATSPRPACSTMTGRRRGGRGSA